MNVSFINCCAVSLPYIAHSFCLATLSVVLGSCLQKSKFYRGVPEPPGTPPPYAPVVSFDVVCIGSSVISIMLQKSKLFDYKEFKVF